MEKAGFIGRFQPFHKGHKKVVEKYKDQYDLVLVIGSAQESRTEENPLNAEEREELIKECFPDIKVVHLEDYKTDEEWCKVLEEKTDAETVITQNETVQNIVEEKSDLNLERQEMFDPEIYSGSEVRRRIKSGEEWRYLVPSCCKQKLEQYIEKIKDSGVDYNFEPGWKKEYSAHGKTKN